MKQKDWRARQKKWKKNRTSRMIVDSKTVFIIQQAILKRSEKAKKEKNK